MRNTAHLFFLLLALANIAIFTPQASAHGTEGRFAKEVKEISERTDHPELERMEGIRLFSWRLFLHGMHLMTEEQYDNIERAHKYIEVSDRTEAKGKTPDLTANADRFRYEGQKLLLQILGALPQTNVVSVQNGVVDFDEGHVFELSGNSGCLLFKVSAEGDGTTFVTIPWELTAYDLDRVSEQENTIRLLINPTGTTWVTYRVKDAPPEKMVTFIELVDKESGELIGKFYTTIQSGPLGRLRLKVVDENGVDTPTMIRLTYEETGAMYRPSGALEAEDMLRNISGEPVPSAARPLPRSGEPIAYWIPGPFGGHYWCLAESVDMMLPAGKWKAHLWKGTEFITLIEEFEVPIEGEQEVVNTMKRWINMGERGWWSGDAHIHSRLMSDKDAERLLILCEASDIHVANIVRMGNYLRTFFEQRGYGKAYRVVRGNRALVPGQEDPRAMYGHSLAINIDHPVRNMEHYFATDWVAQETHKAGGLYGHAHMTFNGFDIERDLTVMMPEELSDFGEIMQIGELETKLYHRFLNLGYKLTAAAGSDLPFGHGLGEVRHYVYTGSSELNVDDWFEAMKAGRTFVSNGPMLTFRVNEALPGDEIVVGDNQKLRVYATAESLMGEETHIKRLTVLKNGESIARKKNKDPECRSLTIELEVDSEYGFWIAAEAENEDGTKAHTTPVYVTRTGFRRWNYEQVPGILAQCEAKLDELEMELSDSIAGVESGVYPKWNYFYQSTAEYAPLELERIARVRALYEQLKTVYERESKLRPQETQGGNHD